MNRDEAAALRDEIEREHSVYPRLMETALLCTPDGWRVRVLTDRFLDVSHPDVDVTVDNPAAKRS